MLQTINQELKSIGVPYEYMRWTGKVQYPYFVGEDSEIVTDTEDGQEEYTMMLTGTAKGNWSELLTYKNKIKDHFSPVYGLRKSTTSGAMVIMYENSTPIDTGDAELKRIQINLRIKLWKGLN